MEKPLAARVRGRTPRARQCPPARPLPPNARSAEKSLVPLLPQEVVAWIRTTHALPLRQGLCGVDRDRQWVLSPCSVAPRPVKPENTDTCLELLGTQKRLLFQIFRQLGKTGVFPISHQTVQLASCLYPALSLAGRLQVRNCHT